MSVIEYESLNFENGYIYRSCEIPFLKQGLVLVRGLNLDDGGFLGAGKSSVFEVFSQIQFGKGGKRDFRMGDHKAELVNSFTNEGYRATLRLRVDGHPFEMTQYRNHPEFKNRYIVIDRETGADVFPRDITVRRSPFKWVREKFLRMDETSFFNLVYLAQETNNVMIHGRESERRKRLTAMFNLDIYDELQKATKRTLSMHVTTISDMERISDELQEVRAHLAQYKNMKQLESDLDAARAELQGIQATVDEQMAEYRSLVKLKGRTEQRRDLIHEVRRLFESVGFGSDISQPQDITEDYVAELKQKHDNTRSEYVTKKNSLERLRRRAVVREQLKKITARNLDVVQNELSTVKGKLRDLQHTELPQAEERVEIESDMQKIGKPTTSISTLEDEFQQAVRDASRLENQIDTLSSQVSKAVCPTCHRPMQDFSAAELAEKQDELTAKRGQLEDTIQYRNNTKRKLTLARKYGELVRRLKTLRTDRSPSEVQADINKLVVRERNLMTELESAQRRIRLEGQLEDMPDEREDVLFEEVARLEKLSGILQRRHSAAAGILERIPKIIRLPKSNIEELSVRIDILATQLKKASKIISTASDQVTKLSGRLDRYRQLRNRKAQLQKSLDDREAILQEVSCLKALKKAFEPKGLKQDRFKSILHDASERTVPMYSNLLWPNGDIALGLAEKEGSLHFELTRKKSKVITSSSLLSGGERRKSGLAFLFGMRDLKELYTGSRTNVLIVDEPFGDLDPQGTESLISIFSVLKERFDSIFVISHRPEVMEHPVWDQTWWAIRENDNAKMWRTQPPAKYLRMAAELVKQ